MFIVAIVVKNCVRFVLTPNHLCQDANVFRKPITSLKQILH